jgi:formylglycine-generating enzyme required for sulfatase activity
MVSKAWTLRVWAAGLITCCWIGAEATGAPTAGGTGMVIEGVDHFRVAEPLFEGVRIVLNHRGEDYTADYIQGISGAAFRIAGICPCAADCSSQMGTDDLIRLLGYEHTQDILGWTGDVDDAKRNMVPLIPKIRDSIRAGRPVLLWYGFADSAYEVVTGFDEAEGVFLGHHMWQGPQDGAAKAKQDRAQEAAAMFPAFGAIFIGRKVGVLNARAAEMAALREAVRHARDAEVRTAGPPRQGLTCYDFWVEKFKSPGAKRDPGDSYCSAVYRTTHRAAGQFLREIAPRYPQAEVTLNEAAAEFAAEAVELDKAAPNEKLWPILAKARDHYAAGIALIEQALTLLADASGHPWEAPGIYAAQEIAGPDNGKMVWVPAGEFVMGSEDADAEANPDERPAHPVRITRGFWLGKCPVTLGQWKAYCQKQGIEVGKESAPGDDHPVVCVSWERATAYCRCYGLELPTEAQWEYAARGPQARKYPWADRWDEQKCCNEANKGPEGSTFPVGSFPARASWCGALDMAGNAWQWCTDWYDGTYYQTLPVVDPPGPVEGSVSGLGSTEPRRVLRGGTFGLGALGCRAAIRCRDRVTATDSDYGFRVTFVP